MFQENFQTFGAPTHWIWFPKFGHQFLRHARWTLGLSVAAAGQNEKYWNHCAAPAGAKSIPAGDAVDTQPIDILAALPPDPSPDTALSPGIPSSKKREAFQRKSCPKSTTKPTTLDREVDKKDKKEEPPEEFTATEDEAHMGPYSCAY